MRGLLGCGGFVSLVVVVFEGLVVEDVESVRRTDP